MAVSQGSEELVSRHLDALAIAAREAASAAPVVHDWGQHLAAVLQPEASCLPAATAAAPPRLSI